MSPKMEPLGGFTGSNPKNKCAIVENVNKSVQIQCYSKNYKQPPQRLSLGELRMFFIGHAHKRCQTASRHLRQVLHKRLYISTHTPTLNSNGKLCYITERSSKTKQPALLPSASALSATGVQNITLAITADVKTC